MQKPIKIIPVLKLGLKVSVIIGVIFFFLQMSGEVKAAVSHLKTKSVLSVEPDSSVSSAIKIAKNAGSLLFPLSVERFYAKNGNKLVWIAPEKIKTHNWDAMLLLDCVIQYGLVPADYHPTELTYNQLHLLVEHPEKVTNSQQAAYDILLTDAMITLINNLHFGKLNVNYPPEKLDAGNFEGCHADIELANALNQQDFIRTVESLQPKTKAYTNLQYHMHLLTGVYTGDNYELSETDVKKMAINMERLRWAVNDQEIYIAVNIPSFTLEFHRPDMVYQFRILAGKPVTPTPSFASAIGSIQVSKGWNTSSRRIYFTFYNREGIYLGNTPDQLSFRKEDRAVSNGTLNVEQAQKLAGLLLTNDGNLKSVPLITKALKKNESQTFILKKKIPFEVTYITCAVDEGTLVIYNDIYQLDQNLEMKLYNVTNSLALDLNTKNK
ncbi:L,D-transpeptidase catalytic domain [Mucilaginibacter lappiensis]|uniref:Murein L,D-transpeptidase YcbB/YkuD n=1 Tax=Mucilaginibacter lappiensis TaxID=354630 RepID=A0ABR6PTD8_9SPHI|nr:L,D-transpeptidase family protein [Mucilaginibacter lappiensis]MBB6113048.1 murein L,D-transpeptidase YcbB/YkuD [Mucilaginibacter lappiensis]SIS10984.1 L,D-transpeptidase catalytic domain [Mucilaginibacter lappiensis]